MLDRVAHDEINLRQHFSADPGRRGIGRRPGRGVDHGAEPVRNGAFQNRLQIGDQFLRRITLGRCRLNRNRSIKTLEMVHIKKKKKVLKIKPFKV